MLNIKMLLSTEYIPKVDIRISLDASNADRVPELIRNLAELNAQNRINISLGLIAPTFASPTKANAESVIAEKALVAWKTAKECGFAIPEEFLTGPWCVAIAKHSATIQPDGSLQKCFCTTGRKEYDFGTIFKNTSEPYLKDIRFEQFKRTDECISEKCKFLPLCGGGCIYNAMVKQGSTYTFLKDSRWLTKETEHYIFRYFNESKAEKDIEIIIATQEAAFKKITAFLGVESPHRKIEYYFYPDKETKKTLMGDDWYAQSILAESRIHVLYTKDDMPLGEHEDTHLLSLPLGVSIGFLQEGLAEFMVGHAWDGKSHISYVKEGYEKKLYPQMSDFFEHKAWLRTDNSKPLYFYSLAGAFVAFLINDHGKDKFIELYKNTKREMSKPENIAVFEKIYGPLNIIEKKFIVSIA